MDNYLMCTIIIQNATCLDMIDTNMIIINDIEIQFGILEYYKWMIIHDIEVLDIWNEITETRIE